MPIDFFYVHGEQISISAGQTPVSELIVHFLSTLCDTCLFPPATGAAPPVGVAEVHRGGAESGGDKEIVKARDQQGE